MKRLTKADITRRGRITDGLREAAKKLEESHRVLNEAASAQNDQIAAYNEALEEARGFADDMVQLKTSCRRSPNGAWKGIADKPMRSGRAKWSGLELTDLSPIEVLEFESLSTRPRSRTHPRNPSAPNRCRGPIRQIRLL